MGRIVDEDAATRLARAIVADIALYHESEIATGAPGVRGAVDEGRALFQERVDPPLHIVFERVIADSQLAPWAPPPGADGYRAWRMQVPVAQPRAPEPPTRSARIPILLGATAVGVAAYYYFTWYAR